MKYLPIFAVSVCAFFIFCCFKFKSEDYEKIANTITFQTASAIKDEKDLHLIGVSGGMMDNIKMMGMGFECKTTADIKTARKLLLDIVNRYLININGNNKIKPYLHNYPFTANNVDVKIFFRDLDKLKTESDIDIASANEGTIYYYKDWPEKYDLKILHEETYEEAMQALKSEG